MRSSCHPIPPLPTRLLDDRPFSRGLPRTAPGARYTRRTANRSPPRWWRRRRRCMNKTTPPATLSGPSVLAAADRAMARERGRRASLPIQELPPRERGMVARRTAADSRGAKANPGVIRWSASLPAFRHSGREKRNRCGLLFFFSIVFPVLYSLAPDRWSSSALPLMHCLYR